MPTDAIVAYVGILHRLVTATATTNTTTHQPQQPNGYATADKNKLVASGALVYLASLLAPRFKDTPQVAAMVKDTMLHLCKGGNDKIVAILKSNIARRVADAILAQLESSGAAAGPYGLAARATAALSTDGQQTLATSLALLHALCDAVCDAKARCLAPPLVDKTHSAHLSTLLSSKMAGASSASSALPSASAVEAQFQLRALRHACETLLATPAVLSSLCRTLDCDLDVTAKLHVLHSLRKMASSFGFAQMLDALAQNGGRYLAKVVACLASWQTAPPVAFAAVELVRELTRRPDGRAGLTTAGAVGLLARFYPLGGGGFRDLDDGSKHVAVLSLVCLALFARQTPFGGDEQQPQPAQSIGSDQDPPDPEYATLAGALRHLYALLLASVDADGARACDRMAQYLLSTASLPHWLDFLLQCSPSAPEPPHQSAHQRNVSCVVLARWCKTPQVADAAFSEECVEHLALALQACRLDEIEHKLVRASHHELFVHRLAIREACKALSRLVRTRPPAPVTLRPSLTSAAVPLQPQALGCDVVCRLHALEDVIVRIRPPK